MFDPQAMLRLARMLPKASERYQHKHRSHTGGADGACGICPYCGELVVIDHLDRVAGTGCPSCGLSLNRLVPLGDRT